MSRWPAFHDRISNARELSSSTGSQKLTNVSLKDPSDPLPLTFSLSLFVISLFSNNHYHLFSATSNSSYSWNPYEKFYQRVLAPSFNLHGPTIDNFVFHPSLRALIRSMFVDEYWLQEWTIISCSFFLLIDSLGQTATGSTGIATKRYVRRTALFLLFGTREKCLL